MARPKKSETAAKPPKKAKGHNMVDPATKKQFIEMRDHWKTLDERAKSAAGKRSQYQGEIKKAGFSMLQIKDAVRCSTPEGEADFKAEMANRMLAAAYADADIGEQLHLFLDEPRVPAVDRAAKEGQTAAMENKAHAPPYDPSVPQYKAWSDAFYAEQERQVKAGISKLDAKKAAANAAGGKKRGRPPGPGKKSDAPAGSERTLIPKAEKEAKAAARAPKVDDAPPRRPAAAPATRSSLKAEREAVREEAESYFTQSEPAGNA